MGKRVGWRGRGSWFFLWDRPHWVAGWAARGSLLGWPGPPVFLEGVGHGAETCPPQASSSTQAFPAVPQGPPSTTQAAPQVPAMAPHGDPRHPCLPLHPALHTEPGQRHRGWLGVATTAPALCAEGPTFLIHCRLGVIHITATHRA